jgi:mevalonate kinase
MKQTFYSNGKLLITAEYVVLDGAIALALPTKFGQNLTVEPAHDKGIQWTSYDADGSCWFESFISFESIQKKELSDTSPSIRNTLIEILHEAYVLNSGYILNSDGYVISTALTFPKNWGLGTSSTLINNLATWLAIDAYTLLKNSFGGSGYDLACAQNNAAILYQLIDNQPKVEIVPFAPSFAEHIYFVYLNKKQSSKAAIASYFNRLDDIQQQVPFMSELTKKILSTDSLEQFCSLLHYHETEMSSILEQQTIQESLFPDFKGVIKSLGAWGGDFIMVVSNDNPKPYFLEKGYPTLLTYHEMIL